MPTLTIKRGDQRSDRLRSYKVYIDGGLIDNIKNNSVKEYDVSEGHHEVQLRIDWNGSEKLSISVGSAGLTLACGSNILPAPFRSTFLSAMANVVRTKGWIWLREDAVDPSRKS